MPGIPAFKAVVEWRELWRIVDYRDGLVYNTAPTGLYIQAGQDTPDGFRAVSICAKPGTIVNITPFEG